MKNKKLKLDDNGFTIPSNQEDNKVKTLKVRRPPRDVFETVSDSMIKCLKQCYLKLPTHKAKLVPDFMTRYDDLNKEIQKALFEEE